MAARLDVSEVMVSRWMTDGANGRNPSVQTLQKIADILETTPDYLLGKDGKELQQTQNTAGDGVNWGAILARTALTATGKEVSKLRAKKVLIVCVIFMLSVLIVSF
ncbi:MAG: helix-turn-helix transcriptional regulator [Treponema sp.]|nr:helix-turn-helix transcriptional regulator [Treponema sp.]